MCKMKFLLKFTASNDICFVAPPGEAPAEFCHNILKSSLSCLVLLFSTRTKWSLWWVFVKFLTENANNYSISTYRKSSLAISDLLIYLFKTWFWVTFSKVILSVCTANQNVQPYIWIRGHEDVLCCVPWYSLASTEGFAFSDKPTMNATLQGGRR